MKLYKVEVRGLFGIGMNYNESYAVADNPDEAYKIVREFLDKNGIGHESNRGMLSVELLADTKDDNDTNTMLFIREAGK